MMSTTSEWGIFVEPDQTIRNYFCNECLRYSGNMRVRNVVDRDNNAHKEYKVVCNHCSQSGTLHWSKNLAEHSWKAQNPNLREDYITKDLDEIKKG